MGIIDFGVEMATLLIEHENWNTQDTSFKPICDRLRGLGYEILEGVK